MNLLNKFENIEIKNDARVPAEDLKVIEGYSKEFEEYRNRVLQYELIFKNKPLIYPSYNDDKIDSNYKQERFLVRFYEDFMNESQCFISKIIRYFKNKYQIELENNFKKKGKEYNTCRKIESEERLDFYKNFTYNDVLDDIFEQLEGFDLNSKAEQEIKDNMKKMCRDYRSGEKIKLSKNKISLKDIYIITYDSIWERYEINYNTEDNLKILLNAMNYFENDSTEITELNNMFLNEYGGINRHLGDDFLFQKHGLNFSKIKSFKFFKNKRIDIEFTSGQYALEFAKDYCGYIG
ncbi:hypothetical protein FDJ70_06010 [Clostridium botulinum]|uniref:hypothetical protein n=1 Tax=Clostridium botulinum TaxID=1491 RepID=UPI0013FA8FF0|nr:hypothetical protein [Clostridium botulinum]MCD3245241.1 hypothetical protein [Clostridium botulinum C]MCD3261620.1 hypothetical protein [Clostridium botulinum C]NFV47228.1 hypothetical protein [Clostridium botulinum]